jgi:crotonobetainyl-CoA:carnitine CoA-transferase CaiB-like acyl-CoA transferase
MYFSEEALPMRRPAPRLGEHSAEVLGLAGYGPEEVAELIAAGVAAEAGAEAPRSTH